MFTSNVTKAEADDAPHVPSVEHSPKQVLMVMSPVTMGKVRSSKFAGSLQGSPAMFSLQL
jgi:hypothetical protein